MKNYLSMGNITPRMNNQSLPKNKMVGRYDAFIQEPFGQNDLDNDPNNVAIKFPRDNYGEVLIFDDGDTSTRKNTERGYRANKGSAQTISAISFEEGSQIRQNNFCLRSNFYYNESSNGICETIIAKLDKTNFDGFICYLRMDANVLANNFACVYRIDAPFSPVGIISNVLLNKKIVTQQEVKMEFYYINKMISFYVDGLYIGKTVDTTALTSNLDSGNYFYMFGAVKLNAVALYSVVVSDYDLIWL